MNNTLKQMIKSFFLGAIATVVDFAVFALCYYVIFYYLSTTPFVFGPFNYGVEDGGAAYFVSVAISYLLSQSVNYFVQRKYAFNAESNKVSSFVLYLFSSFISYLIMLYIPGLIGGFINGIFGHPIGPLVTKAVSNFIGFLLLFPIHKFIIFKN